MEKMKMHTPDLTEDNIARIRELFPDCVTEVKDDQGNIKLAVDFDQLKQELSGQIVEGPQERYHLNWPGKREALLTANAPIAKTLRPCQEESVDFDNTKNLFIEGDNLDALKLLQETYLGKVKMIYIDPPYNTSNDFIYEDDFAIDSETYLKASNQMNDQGAKLVANPESNGRKHSDWLSMVYPRIKLARNLLSEEGVIFISIDDKEQENLKKVCNEIFGYENFVAQFIWKSRVSEDNRKTTGVSTDHEYVLCFSNGNTKMTGIQKDLSKFKNSDNDPRGPWRSADLTGLLTADQRPNCHYDLENPETGVTYKCPPKGWRYDKNTMAQKISEKRILWPTASDGRPRHKLFMNEMSTLQKNVTSVITEFNTQQGTKELDSLLGPGIFNFPKPSIFIKYLLAQGTQGDDIILDFFAGSGTTAHAVMQLNAEDGRNRQTISIQLPEKCIENSAAFKAGFKTISEIGKERIRRSGNKVLEGECHQNWNKDIGFRVLKIDSSNMADIYYIPDSVEQKGLLDAVNNIKPDRDNPEDLLFQVLLDWGVDLTLPIRKETIQGKTVFFVSEEPYDLIACFDEGITEELVKELAGHKALRVVFRDNGFISDAVKINVDQIFKQLSPGTEVKSI